MTAISNRNRMKTGSKMLPFAGRKTIFTGDLVTSNNQFGFKKQLSCSYAVPILHLAGVVRFQSWTKVQLVH